MSSPLTKYYGLDICCFLLSVSIGTVSSFFHTPSIYTSSYTQVLLSSETYQDLSWFGLLPNLSYPISHNASISQATRFPGSLFQVQLAICREQQLCITTVTLSPSQLRGGKVGSTDVG